MDAYEHIFKGKMIMEIVDGLPTVEPGRLVFNSADGKGYYGGPSSWIELGGSGGWSRLDWNANSDDVMSVMVIQHPSLNIQDHGGTLGTKITPYDLIWSVRDGTPPYTFYIKKTGDIYGAGNTDPKIPYVLLDCTDVYTFGQNIIVKVEDSIGNVDEVTISLRLNDPNGLCGV